MCMQNLHTFDSGYSWSVLEIVVSSQISFKYWAQPQRISTCNCMPPRMMTPLQMLFVSAKKPFQFRVARFILQLLYLPEKLLHSKVCISISSVFPSTPFPYQLLIPKTNSSQTEQSKRERTSFSSHIIVPKTR